MLIIGALLVWGIVGTILSVPILIWVDDKTVMIVTEIVGPPGVGLIGALAYEVGRAGR